MQLRTSLGQQGTAPGGNPLIVFEKRDRRRGRSERLHANADGRVSGPQARAARTSVPIGHLRCCSEAVCEDRAVFNETGHRHHVLSDHRSVPAPCRTRPKRVLQPTGTGRAIMGDVSRKDRYWHQSPRFGQKVHRLSDFDFLFGHSLGRSDMRGIESRVPTCRFRRNISGGPLRPARIQSPPPDGHSQLLLSSLTGIFPTS
jgi:hypothetical protein